MKRRERFDRFHNIGPVQRADRRQMSKRTWAALAAALCCLVSPVQAASPDAAQVAAERLLGRDSQPAEGSHLPDTRKLYAWGVVIGSLAESAQAAGVPQAAMLEALQALGMAIDPERDVKDGDLFWVQYEQEYTAENAPIGIGRVLWAELRTAAKGIVAIHRFRIGKSSAEPFWLATGRSAETPPLRLPLNRISISSGFGLRVDPFDMPMPPARATARVHVPSSRIPKPRMKLTSMPRSAMVQTKSPLRGRAVSGRRLASSPAVRAVGRRPTLVMHNGIDLVAEAGTPVYAAAAGIVAGAAPNGGYGNCIEIEHEEALSTVYGHLESFAPGVAAGARVQKGDLIGFVGNTGHSTGPHLHFELRRSGKPIDPVIHMSPPQLSGGDLARFQELVGRNLANAQRQGKPD